MAQNFSTRTHNDDIIFTKKSLEDFIRLIKTQGIENIEFYAVNELLQPIDNPKWHMIYTAYNGSFAYTNNNQSIKYLEFNEKELKENCGKIVIVRKIHPWQLDNVSTGIESLYNINIESGRHLYIQAGSLLKFNPDQSTENENKIDDYWTDTTPGTFSIDENNGQKAHIITIHGFDQNGNFNNKNPIVGYISQNDIPNNTNINGAYKIGSNDYNLTPEQLSKLKQLSEEPYIIPVYLNNNNATITSHEGNFNIINTDQGNFNSITVGGGNGIEFGQDLLVISTTEAERKPGDPNAGNEVSNKDNLVGSIKTLGGIAAGKSIKGQKIYAAVFNDYAECRKTIDLEPGRVVVDNDDGSLSCANMRLLPGAQVISDTYGNLIGEMPGVQTPIAVSGRVLVYPYQNRNNYHAGMAVCSAPNGTVDIMTREEIKEYPDCIIGIVSEIPNYKKWGSDQVNVNNRIWIKVK